MGLSGALALPDWILSTLEPQMMGHPSQHCWTQYGCSMEVIYNGSHHDHESEDHDEKIRQAATVES